MKKLTILIAILSLICFFVNIAYADSKAMPWIPLLLLEDNYPSVDKINLDYEISINDPSSHELFIRLVVDNIDQNILNLGRQRIDVETVSIISDISVKDKDNNPISYDLYEVSPGDSVDIEKITINTGSKKKITVDYKVDLSPSGVNPHWILFEDYGAVESQILFYQPIDATAGEVKVRFLLPDGWRAITRFDNSGDVYRLINIDDVVNHRGLKFYFWGPIIFGNLDEYEQLIGNVKVRTAFYGRQDIQQPVANTVFSIIEWGQNAIGDLTTASNLSILYVYLSGQPAENIFPPVSRDHILGDFRSFSDDYEYRYREYAHIIFHTFFSHEDLKLWDTISIEPEEGIVQFFALKSLEKTGTWELSTVHEELIRWYNDYLNYILGTQYDVPIEPENGWFGFPNNPVDSEHPYGIWHIMWYEKEPLVFWLLNEKIKDVTGDQKNLADVWKYFHDNDPGIAPDNPKTFNEVLYKCNSISGHDFTEFFNYYVTGNNELPFYVDNNMLLIDNLKLPSIPPLN
jgi:hypothetical protein